MATASTLYPEFADLFAWIVQEIDGLTDAQLDWDDQSQEWSKWSIRRQLSHLATAYYFQMLISWGDLFFKDREKPQPVDLKTMMTKYDRRLDEEQFWKLEDILPHVENGINIARGILDRLDESDLQTITMDRVVPPEASWPTSNDRICDLLEQTRKSHPTGIERDAADPNLWHMNAGYIFRHMVWETLTHLNTIQRLKKSQGLPVKVQIPKVGYLQDPFFSGE